MNFQLPSMNVFNDKTIILTNLSLGFPGAVNGHGEPAVVILFHDLVSVLKLLAWPRCRLGE